MPYYNKCDYCDAYLDPGEKCECQKEKKLSDEKEPELLNKEPKKKAV